MTTNKEKKLTSNYKSFFRKKLTDPEFCREYINAALDEVDELGSDTEEVLATLISCLKDIVYAHGGVDKFLEKFNPGIHRQTIYKLIKYPEEEHRKHGPEFLTVYKLIKACGANLRAA